jgi:Ca2+-transporting ATPase
MRITGPEFAALTDEELLDRVQALKIIARARPLDKQRLVQLLQRRGEVVAVTGDGTNDAPALNFAHVGLAMGSGTSVAKEAADIVLLNDAFPSIVTGVKWGRSLYKNIKNFLFFQLSINVSACLVALFGPVVGVGMPFTVTQFLWINLVMDSLAAIALASQPADEKVLGDKPRPRDEFIINGSLSRAIFGFGGFVWILSTLILLGMEHLSALQSAMGDNIIVAVLSKMDLTVFFACYMVINWWNMFNARVIGKGKSIFEGLFTNLRFVGISVMILLTTIFIVQVGGDMFQTHPLTLRMWLAIILLTSPVAFLREIYYQIGRLRKRQ